MMCGISYCRDTRPRVSVKTVWKQRTPREGCPYDVDQEAAPPNEGVRFRFVYGAGRRGRRPLRLRKKGTTSTPPTSLCSATSPINGGGKGNGTRVVPYDVSIELNIRTPREGCPYVVQLGVMDMRTAPPSAGLFSYP